MISIEQQTCGCSWLIEGLFRIQIAWCLPNPTPDHQLQLPLAPTPETTP